MCVQIPTSKERINCWVRTTEHQTTKMPTLSCPVCSVHYTETGEHVAKLLPCTHTVCGHCIEKKLFQYFEKNLKCPICNEQHHYCDGIETVKENKYVEMLIRDSQQDRCTIHRNELSLFCEEPDCQTPICALCLKDEHKGHEFDGLQESKEKRLKTLTDEIDSFKKNLTSNREKVEILKRENDQKHIACKEQIELAREQTIRMTHEKFDKLIAAVSEQNSEVTMSLNNAIEKFGEKLQTVQKIEKTMKEEVACKRFSEKLKTVKTLSTEIKNLGSELNCKYLEFTPRNLKGVTVRSLCGSLTRRNFQTNASLHKTRSKTKGEASSAGGPSNLNLKVC